MPTQGREWMMLSSADPRLQLKVILAASALLYRVSWPFIDAYTPSMPQGALYYSLVTKFLFTLIGLGSFMSLFPVLKPGGGLDSRSPASSQFTYDTAIAIYMLVTTINYVAGWRWGLVAIGDYFTRGYLFNDPSPFDRSAVLLSSFVFSVAILAIAVAQWMRIGTRWQRARKALWLQEVGYKDALRARTVSAVVMEKAWARNAAGEELKVQEPTP